MVATPLATTVPNRPHTADAIAPASMPVRMLWRLMCMRMKFWAKGPAGAGSLRRHGREGPDCCCTGYGVHHLPLLPRSCKRSGASTAEGDESCREWTTETSTDVVEG